MQNILHTDSSLLTKYKDITPELANRIANLFTGYDSYTEFCMKLKNKQWTYSRISRCLIHILLEITDEICVRYETNLPYIRILGLNEKGRIILSERKKNITESIPIINKVADYKELSKEDIYATDLFNLILFNKFGYVQKNEFTHGIIFSSQQ